MGPNHQICGMTNEKAVAEKLLQVSAVRLNPQQPFTWASGWKSPIYCDNRKILGFPYVRDFVKSELCNVIFDKFPDAELLAGVATAGIGSLIFGLFLFVYMQLDVEMMESIKVNEPMGRYLNPYIAAFIVVLEGFFSGFLVTFVLLNWINTDEVNVPQS